MLRIKLIIILRSIDDIRFDLYIIRYRSVFIYFLFYPQAREQNNKGQYMSFTINNGARRHPFLYFHKILFEDKMDKMEFDLIPFKNSIVFENGK